jgi:hypothetical protein
MIEPKQREFHEAVSESERQYRQLKIFLVAYRQSWFLTCFEPMDPAPE